MWLARKPAGHYVNTTCRHIVLATALVASALTIASHEALVFFEAVLDLVAIIVQDELDRCWLLLCNSDGDNIHVQTRYAPHFTARPEAQTLKHNSWNTTQISPSVPRSHVTESEIIRYPWISMDIHGSWISHDINGYRHMSTHGFPCIYMKIHRCGHPWKSEDTYRYLLIHSWIYSWISTGIPQWK